MEYQLLYLLLQTKFILLEKSEYHYLAIINKFNGGPVGIDAISSSIGEEVTTIEDVYEPYLLQQGLLKRTSRGRIVTDKAYEVLGITKKDKNTQTSLDLN